MFPERPFLSASMRPRHATGAVAWAAVRILVVLVLISSSGCKGGGARPPGAPSPDVPPPAPLPEPCIPTAEFGCLPRADHLLRLQAFADLHEAADDFKNQWGLEAINAARAYAHVDLAKGAGGAPGAGVTVGFVDTGIDLAHPLFTGDVTEEFLFMAADETGAASSHGTSVASIVGADADGLVPAARHRGFRGVAWGADLRMVAIPVESGGGPYSPISLGDFAYEGADFKAIAEHILPKGIDILNLSVSVDGIIDNYSEQDLRDNFGEAIEAMAQAGVTDKTILVWAGGNAHGDPCVAGTDNCVVGTIDPQVRGAIDAVSVEVLAGLPARIAELRGHSVAVVAVRADSDADGYPEIAPFSNRCGIVADWCIAAPGADVSVAFFGPIDGAEGSRGLGTAGGTSFAAPMVSGGLAVMKQLFRDQLSSTALVERLYRTANKEGPFSDAAVYGQGLMDLGAATSPVGTATVTMGGTVDGAGFDARTTGVSPGPAFGDGLARALAGREIVAFDRLGAPFWFGLSAFADHAAEPTLSVQLNDLLTGTGRDRHEVGQHFPSRSRWTGTAAAANRNDGRLRFGALDPHLGGARGHLSLAQGALALAFGRRDGLRAAAFATPASIGRAPATGLVMAYQPRGVPAALQVGWLGERQTLLGTATAGGFGQMAGRAIFLGLSAELEMGAWTLSADAEIGAVSPRVHSGLVTGISSLATSAFALGLSRGTAAGGTVTIGLSQPLRVNDGDAALSIPVGRTKGGGVVRSSVEADLTPSGRQLEISLRAGRPLAAGGEVLADVTWTEDPGHEAHARSSLRVLAGWRARF